MMHSHLPKTITYDCILFIVSRITQVLHSTMKKNHFTALAGKLSLYIVAIQPEITWYLKESDSVLAKCMVHTAVWRLNGLGEGLGF